MSKHIGIIGCSYEGAALCYRTICNEGSGYLGRHDHPETTLHTIPLTRYMEHIESGDWQGVANLLLHSARKLAAAGADFLISPDNTIHQAFPLVCDRSPLPWLHIAREVVCSAQQQNFSRLGILGTRFLMEGPVYEDACAERQLETVVPVADHRQRINSIIFDELVYGEIKQISKHFFISVIDEFMERGCDAVVLGCTEIPLIVLPRESPLPVLDSTRILARAALKFAILNG